MSDDGPKNGPQGGIRAASNSVEYAADTFTELVQSTVRPLIAAIKKNGIRIRLVKVNDNSLMDWVMKNAPCPYELELYFPQ